MNYSITISEFEEELLILHNVNRRKHSADDLLMDKFVNLLIYFIYSA